MSFDLNYHSQGNGIPLVFQHGLGSNIDQVKKLLHDIEGLHVISLDCPGHGKSLLKEEKVPSFDFYADEVIRLLAHLKIEKAFFGGISMGAGISTNIALRYPNSVNGLILVRPAWLDQMAPKNLEILLDAAELIPKESGKEEFKKSDDFLAIKRTLPNAAESILGVFANTQCAEFPFVLKKMVNSTPFPNLENLKKIKKPSIILASEDDPLHPFEMAENIHQNIKESEIHKVSSRYINDSKHTTEIKTLIKLFMTKNEVYY